MINANDILIYLEAKQRLASWCFEIDSSKQEMEHKIS